MLSSELLYTIAFSRIQCVGPMRFQKILQGFQSFEYAWGADVIDFIKIGIEEATAQKIVTEKKHIDPLAEGEILEKEKISVVTFEDKTYPKLLKEIPQPPLLLFYKGVMPELPFPIAVVGTRKVSPYGIHVTDEIVSKLGHNGFAIISGLALGVDAIAHEVALKTGGVTWAILGGGIDQKTLYPQTNFHLAQRILAMGGALISEYPPYTRAYKGNFPQRNRIIAGLSLGVLVSEAPIKSGALITSHYALEYNREVFAVPGSIFNKNSEGTNYLIKLGAHPVTSADDIFDECNIPKILTDQKTTKKILSPQDRLIVDAITDEGEHIDVIIQKTGLKSNKVISAITLFELEGIVKNLGNGIYRKI